MLVEQVSTVLNDLKTNFRDFHVERESLLDQNYYQGKFCVGDFFFFPFKEFQHFSLKTPYVNT